jgi:hypothetical protein
MQIGKAGPAPQEIQTGLVTELLDIVTGIPTDQTPNCNSQG